MTQDIRELGSTLSKLNIWALVAAVGLYGVAQAFFVMRWRLLSGVQSAHFGFFTGLKLHFLGLFYNNCLPSSVGGDLIRAWYVTHHCDADKRDEAALSVFVDRVVGLFGMIIMACFCYWVIPGGTEVLAGGEESACGGSMLDAVTENRNMILLFFVVLLAIFGLACLNGRVWVYVKSVFLRGLGLFLRLFYKGLRALKLYAKQPLVVVAALFLTFLTQGLCIIGFYICGRSLGIDVHLRYYFVLFPVSWLIGAIPISVGGMGLMEGALLVGFANLMGGGAAVESLAMAIAICQRLVILVVSLPGIAIHLLGAHLPVERDEFFVDSEASMD